MNVKKTCVRLSVAVQVVVIMSMYAPPPHEEAATFEKFFFHLMPTLNEDHHEIFCSAIKKGHISVAQLVYNYGERENVNIPDEFGWTLLHWAAFRGHTKLVESLCRWGANLEARDKNGLTPVHLAAQQGHRRIVEFLDQQGASLFPLDNEQSSPLWYAVWSGHRGVARYLYDFGFGLEDERIAALNEAQRRGDHKLAHWMRLKSTCSNDTK